MRSNVIFNGFEYASDIGVLERAFANIPLGYFGDPDDVAYAVAFLCALKARYLTGQRMYVDGGMHRAL